MPHIVEKSVDSHLRLTNFLMRNHLLAVENCRMKLRRRRKQPRQLNAFQPMMNQRWWGLLENSHRDQDFVFSILFVDFETYFDTQIQSFGKEESLCSYQILTCVSVRDSDNARLSRSQTDRYLVCLNLFSKATNCS